MEKASDVYNKLKLRFVGKAEVAAKPQTENKEPEDDEKETQETGKKPPFSSFFTLSGMVCFALYAYIDLNYAFPDSAPVNGESEQKKDNMETEEPPKSPAHEENNDNTPSSPNR